jgi:hypothetical protein
MEMVCWLIFLIFDLNFFSHFPIFLPVHYFTIKFFEYLPPQPSAFFLSKNGGVL